MAVEGVEMEGCELFVSRVCAATEDCSEANTSNPGSVAEH